MSTEDSFRNLWDNPRAYEYPQGASLSSDDLADWVAMSGIPKPGEALSAELHPVWNHSGGVADDRKVLSIEWHSPAIFKKVIFTDGSCTEFYDNGQIRAIFGNDRRLLASYGYYGTTMFEVLTYNDERYVQAPNRAFPYSHSTKVEFYEPKSDKDAYTLKCIEYSAIGLNGNKNEFVREFFFEGSGKTSLLVTESGSIAFYQSGNPYVERFNNHSDSPNSLARRYYYDIQRPGSGIRREVYGDGTIMEWAPNGKMTLLKRPNEPAIRFSAKVEAPFLTYKPKTIEDVIKANGWQGVIEHL